MIPIAGNEQSPSKIRRSGRAALSSCIVSISCSKALLTHDKRSESWKPFHQPETFWSLQAGIWQQQVGQRRFAFVEEWNKTRESDISDNFEVLRCTIPPRPVMIWRLGIHSSALFNAKVVAGSIVEIGLNGDIQRMRFGAVNPSRKDRKPRPGPRKGFDEWAGRVFDSVLSCRFFLHKGCQPQTSFCDVSDDRGTFVRNEHSELRYFYIHGHFVRLQKTLDTCRMNRGDSCVPARREKEKTDRGNYPSMI
ncbi:hypothetical protein C8J56DRAFT_897417 [Mycena floridula]|nr:hypothetical protein C8J56DRAFT_897417 [Mycena floridula]